LDPTLNKENIDKIKESQGKSGSFFFFTHDNRYLVKTITNNELQTMLGFFMKCYYEHIANNSETLITKIYGLYSIEIK
jgi:1-phosphatidylinositol-4-phosphate 5-kinase